MKILFAKTFTKKYWKLPEALRERVNNTIAIFRKDPLAPSLRNHPLKGDMKGQHSFSAGFDLRIILRNETDMQWSS